MTACALNGLVVKNHHSRSNYVFQITPTRQLNSQRFRYNTDGTFEYVIIGSVSNPGEGIYYLCCNFLLKLR